MFEPQIEEGAKPTSAEQGLYSHHDTSMHDDEHDFDLVYLEANEEH